MKGDFYLSPAHGRPPSKDPKIHNTRIRMSDEELDMLEYCVKQTGLSKTDVIRKGIKEIYEQLKKK